MQKIQMHSKPDIEPPSRIAHDKSPTTIPYYTVFLYIATFDIPSQIAVSKQWRYIGLCPYVLGWNANLLLKPGDTNSKQRA